jgi:hypothetical protein
MREVIFDQPGGPPQDELVAWLLAAFTEQEKPWGEFCDLVLQEDVFDIWETYNTTNEAVEMLDIALNVVQEELYELKPRKNVYLWMWFCKQSGILTRDIARLIGSMVLEMEASHFRLAPSPWETFEAREELELEEEEGEDAEVEGGSVFREGIVAVLGQVHPEMTISTEGVQVIEELVQHWMYALGSEAGRARQSKEEEWVKEEDSAEALNPKKRERGEDGDEIYCLNRRDIQRGLINFKYFRGTDGELLKHAVSEGVKATTIYHAIAVTKETK